MPFQYILANLLAEVEGSVGVLFLDETGETVDLSCSEFTPYQLRVLGAYLGIYQRQIDTITHSHGLSAAQFLHIEKDAVHIYAAPLPDGYYLVLVQRRPGPVGPARRLLLAAAEQLEQALFAPV